MTAADQPEADPVIGITCGTTLGLPGADPVKYAVNLSYVQAVERSGGVPLLLVATDRPGGYRRLMDLVDGLLVTGGPDLAPSLFGEEPHRKLGRVNPLHDALEAAVIPEALERDLPILGICRGCQAINVFAGGTLYQDLSEAPFGVLQHAQAAHRTVPTHEVLITDGSRLHRILGATTVRVNSTHHQGLRDVAPGFEVVARSRDGLVEAIERQGARFCIGVQWHPEELLDGEPVHRRLFAAFVDAARDI
jgi:putative glutamine amidotransferase